MSKPDNTQGLDEIFLSFEPYKGADYGSMTEYRITKIRLDEAKQALLDWHNKQTLELLDRLESLNGSHPDSYIATFIEAERNELKERDDE